MKIMHHLQTHNEQVEGEIKKGVQLAIDEISNDGFLANKVRLAVLNAIDRSMMWSLTEYKITDEVNKIMRGNLSTAINSFAEGITKSMIEKLNNPYT